MIDTDEKDKLYHLNPSNVAHYLYKNGWKRLSYEYENIALFSYKLPNKRNIKLLLPLSKDAPDFENRISDAIHILESLENRSSLEIINSIITLDRDVLYVRIARGTNLRSLNFNDAVTVIENIQDLLIYSASGELESKKYFTKPLKRGEDFVGNCNFGHTFEGSFGFSIELPVPCHIIEHNLIEEDKDPYRPFSRKVMERIVKGLNDAQEAVLDSKTIVNNSEKGLNANMCNALLEISSCVGEVEYLVKWSPEWYISEEIINKSQVCINQRAIEYLKFASKQLTLKNENKRADIKEDYIGVRYDVVDSTKKPIQPGLETITPILKDTKSGLKVNAGIIVKNGSLGVAQVVSGEGNIAIQNNKDIINGTKVLEDDLEAINRKLEDLNLELSKRKDSLDELVKKALTLESQLKEGDPAKEKIKRYLKELSLLSFQITGTANSLLQVFGLR